MIRSAWLWFRLGSLIALATGCVHTRPPTTSVEAVDQAPEGTVKLGTVLAPCGGELLRLAQRAGADYMIVHRWNGHGNSGGCHAELFADDAAH
jgi:hypothetical protein